MQNRTNLLTPGTLIDGRYEVISRIGRGGFATVYKAKHQQLERLVALKVLDPITSGTTESFIQRFLSEARIVANLRHPNIVMIYDFGVVQNDQPYIAMDLLEGHDLETELVNRGPLTPERAQKLFLGVLDALEEGHKKRIVHKDLKPSNLFLVHPRSDQEKLVVLDYGIARIADSDTPRLTQTGGYIGTPAYMPPEYIENSIVSPTNDVYQIALILIESLSGQPVIEGKTSVACMVAHLGGARNIPDWITNSAWASILETALKIDHTQRYPHAKPFRDALAAAPFPVRRKTEDETHFQPRNALEQTSDALLGPSTTNPQRGQLNGMQPSRQDIPSPPYADHPQIKTKKSKLIWVLLFFFVGIPSFLLCSFLIVIYGYYGSFEDYGEALSQSMNEEAYLPSSPPLSVERSVENNAVIKSPKILKAFSSKATAIQKIHLFSTANAFVFNIRHQVELFDVSVQNDGYGHDQLMIPSGNTMLTESAIAMLKEGMAIKKGAKNINTEASALLEHIQGYQVILEDLNKYYRVQEDYKHDGGNRGRLLHHNLKRADKEMGKISASFQKSIRAEYLRLFKKCASQTKSTDVFRHQACILMLDAEGVRNNLDNPNKAIQKFKKSLGRLQQVKRKNNSYLESKNAYNQHSNFITTAEDFLSQSKEWRDRKPPTKWKDSIPLPNAPLFVHMEFNFLLRSYSTFY